MITCSHCGQRLLSRLGIPMQPKKADIFDYIESLSKKGRGADIETMAWVFYPGESRKVAISRIKVHVSQINDYLVGTDYSIINTQKLIPSDDKRWKGSTGIVYKLVKDK